MGESGGILKTDDGGSNWAVQMSENSYHFYGVHFLNELRGFVVGTYLGIPHVSVIFSTADGGSAWTSQTFGTDEALSDIYFADESNGWAVGSVSNTGIMLHSSDGG